jgi:hypothetical protein
VNRRIKNTTENLEILLYSKTGSQPNEDHFEYVAADQSPCLKICSPFPCMRGPASPVAHPRPPPISPWPALQRRARLTLRAQLTLSFSPPLQTAESLPYVGASPLGPPVSPSLPHIAHTPWLGLGSIKLRSPPSPACYRPCQPPRATALALVVVVTRQPPPAAPPSSSS